MDFIKYHSLPVISIEQDNPVPKTSLLQVVKQVHRLKVGFDCSQQTSLIVDQIVYVLDLLIVGQFSLPNQVLEYLSTLKSIIRHTQKGFQQEKLGLVIVNLQTLKEKIQYEYAKAMKKGSSRNFKITNQLHRIHKRLVVVIRITFIQIFLQWLEKYNSPQGVAFRSSKLFNEAKQFFKNKLTELEGEKSQKIVCRICEQMIEVQNMNQHCPACEKKADQRKKLLQLNIELANACDQAYKQKHDVQIKQGKRMMQEQKKNRLKMKKEVEKIPMRSLRRTNTIHIDEPKHDDEEQQLQETKQLANINQVMTLIVNFTEKVLNSNANNEDNKLNIVTLNELANAQNDIENDEAQDIIEKVRQCILDRMDYLKIIQNLDFQSQQQQNGEELKKKFHQSTAMSQRQFKFNGQNSNPRIMLRRNDTIEEEEDGCQTPLGMKKSKVMVMSMIGKGNPRRRDSNAMTKSQVVGSMGLTIKSALSRNDSNQSEDNLAKAKSISNLSNSSDALHSPILRPSIFKKITSPVMVRDSVIEETQKSQIGRTIASDEEPTPSPPKHQDINSFGDIQQVDSDSEVKKFNPILQFDFAKKADSIEEIEKNNNPDSEVKISSLDNTSFKEFKQIDSDDERPMQKMKNNMMMKSAGVRRFLMDPIVKQVDSENIIKESPVKGVEDLTPSQSSSSEIDDESKPPPLPPKLNLQYKQKKSIFHRQHKPEEEVQPQQQQKKQSYDFQVISVDRGYNSDSEVVNINAEKASKEQAIGLKDFDFIKPLGQGAYGWVFLAKKKASGDLYAIKIIDCSQKELETQLETLKAERNIFEILSGDYVVKAYYSFSQEQYLCFVQEYMVGGDFSHILKMYTALDEEYAKHYIAEIVLALEYLRQKEIVHRDLKPDNILLDSRGHAKLADFGLSETQFNNRLKLKLRPEDKESNIIPEFADHQGDAQFDTVFNLTLPQAHPRSTSLEQHDSKNKRIVGTPDYIAPEILRGESISNYSADYWSLGVILYEMLCGIPPFNDDSVEKIFDNILNFRIEWPNISDEEEESISTKAYDLMIKLMDMNYKTRLGHENIEEIKNHPFFDGINWSTILNQPGLIVPKMITKDGEQTDKNCEKVQQFLKGLELKENKHQSLASKLKNQLSSLERLDLLVKLSLEEAKDKLQKIEGQENRFKRTLSKVEHFEEAHSTQLVVNYEDIF